MTTFYPVCIEILAKSEQREKKKEIIESSREVIGGGDDGDSSGVVGEVGEGKRAQRLSKWRHITDNRTKIHRNDTRDRLGAIKSD